MPYFDTKHKRKSATLTAIIAIIILFIIFNFGLRYLDPPEEFGIAINFGTTDFGSGRVQPKEALQPPIEQSETQPVQEEEVIEKEIKVEEAEVSKPVEEVTEDVITQNNKEAIAIKRKEEAKRKEAIRKQKAINKKAEEERKKVEAEKKRIAEEERKKVEAEKKRIAEEEKEKSDKRKKLDALFGGIGNDDGKATGGEGDDNKAGDKGKVTGDPNASGFYGNGGGGNGGNYRLGNRKVETMPIPKYDCNEEGKVFVSISVDKSGKVISAQPGVKGTTNSAACLLNRAKEAALKTKFNSDNNAPAKQVGTIIYNFSLN